MRNIQHLLNVAPAKALCVPDLAMEWILACLADGTSSHVAGLNEQEADALIQPTVTEPPPPSDHVRCAAIEAAACCPFELQPADLSVAVKYAAA